ncbi:MAG: hypothetical protein RLZZ156_1407 [Deinococcota bacterium]|jgi:hypothetical protein
MPTKLDTKSHCCQQQNSTVNLYTHQSNIKGHKKAHDCSYALEQEQKPSYLPASHEESIKADYKTRDVVRVTTANHVRPQPPVGGAAFGFLFQTTKKKILSSSLEIMNGLPGLEWQTGLHDLKILSKQIKSNRLKWVLQICALHFVAGQISHLVRLTTSTTKTLAAWQRFMGMNLKSNCKIHQYTNT